MFSKKKYKINKHFLEVFNSLFKHLKKIILRISKQEKEIISTHIEILIKEINKEAKIEIKETKIKEEFNFIKDSLIANLKAIRSLFNEDVLNKEELNAKLKLLKKQILAFIEAKEFLKNIEKVKSKRKFILGAAAVTSLVVFPKCAALMKATTTYEHSENLPLKKFDGLAILISHGTNSWWDAALKPLAKPLTPLYVSRVEQAFKQKANRVIEGARGDDLLKVMKDPKIQNVVIYGHGTKTSWTATDREFFFSELYLPPYASLRKKGLFVRHTCGSVAYPTKYYFYLGKGDQIIFDQYMDSIFKKTTLKKREDIVTTRYLWYNGKKLYPMHVVDLIIISSKNKKNAFYVAWKGVVEYDFKTESVRATPNSVKNYIISERAEQLFKKGAPEIIANYLNWRAGFVNKHAVSSKEFNLLGQPIFKKENIIYWPRVAFPHEWLLDPLNRAKSMKKS